MEDIHRPESIIGFSEEESIIRFLEEDLREYYEQRKYYDLPMLWRKLNGSSCPESQKEEIQELCKKIENIVWLMISLWDSENMDTAKNVLKEKYYNVIPKEQFEEDWNALKEELQRMLQEYESNKRDERIYGISSVTWHNVFKTHGRSIPESMKRDILDTCKKIEAGEEYWYHYQWEFKSVYTSYQVLGQTLLTNIESTDWLEVKKSLQSLHRSPYPKVYLSSPLRTNINVFVDELDGTQHIIENVSRTDSVESLSRKVEQQTGIPKREFTLFHNEDILKPGQSLASTNIRDGSHVQLLPVRKGQEQPTNATDFVNGLVEFLSGQIKKLYNFFPKSFQDQTRKLSETDFVSVSQLICNGWEFLGIQLGLKAVTLDQITEDNSSVRLRIFGMLREWHARNPLEATAGKLLDAIKRCKLACDLETLERVLLTDMPIVS